MSKEAIISILLDKKLVTVKEIEMLRAKKSNKDFLVALLNIYEKRVSNYLSSCELKVKRCLLKNNVCRAADIETVATQRMIDFAYSAILHMDKPSFLLSLVTLLKQMSPDLVIALGMSAIRKVESDSIVIPALKAQIIKVFTSYLARYRLFKEIDYDNLKNICLEVHTEIPNLFPLYLLETFMVQHQIDITLETILTGQNASDVAQIVPSVLAESIKQSPDTFYQCLFHLVFYVTNTLKESVIEAEQQQQFFAYLNDEAKLLEFVRQLCAGYVTSMNSKERQAQVLAANEAVFQSEIGRICLPALSLLGFNVVASLNDFASQRENIDRTKTAIQENRATINQAADDLINRRFAEIDEQLANFKSVWTVGFGPGSGTPGVSLNFK